MDSPIRIDALVAPLRADVVSGASVVAGMATDALRRAALELPADDVPGLRRSLGRVARAVMEAQPAMASLVTLASGVVEAAQGASTLQEAREAAAREAGAFRARLLTRARDLAGHAAGVLASGDRVLTVSSSSAVRRALLLAAESRDISVVCLESRPMNEGRTLAAALAAAGVPVVYAVDAAADVLADACDVVFLGADSVGDRGVVNKIGSNMVALAARERGIPVHVLADETKFLPPGFPQHVDDDRPGGQVWRAPEGVRVWNRYFETVSLDRITSVITESGVLTKADVAELRAGMVLPADLRR